MAKKAASSGGAIIVTMPDIKTIEVEIVGRTPLICHAFPEKVLKQFEEKKGLMSIDSFEGSPEGAEMPQRSKAKKGKPPRDFDQEYRDSLYPMDDGDGYGMPAICFKHAMVGACRQVDGLDMTLAKRLIFVEPEGYSRGQPCVKIIGTPEKQRDMVKLNPPKGPADVRFRGVFKEWSAILRITFNAEMLHPSSVLSLVAIAGYSEGVGENRPSSPMKCGPHGTWALKQ